MDLARYRSTLAEYEQLYSVVALFDHRFVIHYASETLKKYVELSEGDSRFLELFRVHRPNRVVDETALQKRLGELFLLVSVQDTFAIRGQVVTRHSADGDVFLLLGGPWFEWMRNHRADVALKMSDFSKSDPQLDMLFLMSSNDAQLNDLEELADELRKARDDAITAKTVRSDFFAVMSHEMRTPLNGVISAINLLEDTPLNSEQSPLIQTAGNSARHLLAVINHVLDFSKLEAGKLQLQKTEFDQQALLSAVVSICQAKASEKGLGLTLDIPVDKPLHCLGDEGKIRQILINLVGNAIKFTDKGRVTLALTTSSPADGVCRYRYAVRDTGIGISEEDQQRLFDVFWSSESGHVADASTGLGLNISKQMVEVMGGSLQCDSVIGQGSEFWFELVLPVCETVTRPIETTVRDDIRICESKRVLLVDDNATNVLLGKLMLEKYGMQVETAGDGAQAVDAVFAHHYDLVLMDISMPVMDGIQATSKIKQDGRFDSLPIVALTAHAFDGDKERLLSEGMDGYLTKPIEKAALDAIICKYLEDG